MKGISPTEFAAEVSDAMKEPCLVLRRAAAVLKMKPREVRALVRAEALPAFRCRGHRTLFFKEAEIARYLRRQMTKTRSGRIRLTLEAGFLAGKVCGTLDGITRRMKARLDRREQGA